MVFFIFVQILKAYSASKQWRPSSGLGLHYLPASHKKDVRLIWVKCFDFVSTHHALTLLFQFDTIL